MINRPIGSDFGARHVPPVVKLRPNYSKIVECILFLISEGQKRNIAVTQYAILKALFIADKSHLNTYGRPVTYDNYAAMKDGPVASFAYDLLKHAPQAMGKVGLKEPPWTRTDAPDINRRAMLFAWAREPNKELLSPSDVEAMSDALSVVSSLTFSQIRKLTHEDPAYIAAWRDNGGRNSYDMSYALLFDTPDYEGATELAFFSQHV